MDRIEGEHNKLKQLSQASFLIAISIILFILTEYPLVGAISLFFCPVPLFLITVRSTGKVVFLSFLVISVITFIILGIGGFFFCINVGAIGAGIGLGVKKKYSLIFTLSITVLIVMSISIVNIYSAAAFFDRPDPIGEMNKILDKFFNKIENLFLKMIDQDKTGNLDKDSEKAKIKKILLINKNHLKYSVPSMVLLSFIFMVLINYIVIFWVGKKMKISMPEIKPLEEWSIPWYFIWFLILGWVLVLFKDVYQNLFLFRLGLNLMRFFEILFVVQGLSVLWLLLKLSVSVLGVRIFFSFIAFLIFPKILSILGIAEIWMNFKTKLKSINQEIKDNNN